jgi:integrase
MSPIVVDALRSLWVFWTLRQRFMKVAPAGREERWFIDNHLEWALRRGDQPTEDDEPISGYVFRRGLFFGEEWNRPMTGSNLDKHWEVVMLDAGITRPDGKRKYSFHATRHGAASLFIDSQLPAMNLKTVIGHASVSTTYDVYGHMFPDDERTKDAAILIAGQFSATTERHDAVSP